MVAETVWLDFIDKPLLAADQHSHAGRKQFSFRMRAMLHRHVLPHMLLIPMFSHILYAIRGGNLLLSRMNVRYTYVFVH